ncbi:MAG: AAA family ATPase [Thermoleophilaceae bacterium]
MLPASERQDNPFRYSEPVAVADLIDRDAEATILLERASEGNNSRLMAPRRFGKTSLLRRALHDAEREGWAAVYVDFFGVLTLDDIAQRIERAYAEQLSGRLASWFSGVRRMLRPTVRAGGGPVPGAVELTVDAQAEPPLLERLALPRRLHERHRQRTLVVFDEFQDVLATQDRADAIIRSEIQHHADAASYVFSGSHLGMMRELFADRRRAFYGQAGPVELSSLPAEEVAEYIAERFERTGRAVGGALDPLLDLAGGHPQRTMLLAHAVWERTPSGQAANEETWAAAEDAVARDVHDELRAIWTSLKPSQRRVLAAIAENTQRLYASDRRHGGSRGGAVRSAARALEDRGEIVPDQAASTGYRVTDPLLARWVKAGRPET